MHLYREAYKEGYRIGRAEGKMESLEIIIKCLFANEYDSLKYKIRRLSEYEANLLIKECVKSRDVKYVYEFL